MKPFWALALLVLSGCVTQPSGRDAGGMQGNERAQASARIHTELAGMYYERSLFAIALEELEVALKADANYAPAYNVRALVRMALREDQLADDDFQHGLRLDGNSETHNNYGWFLCQRGRERESIPHFLAAVKNPLYPTPDKALLNAGLCSSKGGEMQAADDFLRRALALHPGMPEALFGMAELNLERGDVAGARAYFTRFEQGQTEPLTAESLWLAVRIERKLGNQNAAESYAMQLRKRYPDARETQLLTYGR